MTLGSTSVSGPFRRYVKHLQFGRMRNSKRNGSWLSHSAPKQWPGPTKLLNETGAIFCVGQNRGSETVRLIVTVL